MLTSWQKQYIDQFIEKINIFYVDASKNYFSGSEKISEFTEEETAYFKSRFSLVQLVGGDEATVMNQLLSDKSKHNFSNYILRHKIFSISVGNMLNDKTCFQLIAETLFEMQNDLYDYQLLYLFIRGYKTQATDHLHVKNLYAQINSQDRLITWCRIRFALLLNDPVLLELAFSKEKVLLTIVSFKMKKPVGIHYPNLLGVANNAFLHYRDQGDILLKAMKHYKVYDEVLKRDQKKSFKYRLEDFQLYKPVQDIPFNELVFKIFPELI